MERPPVPVADAEELIRERRRRVLSPRNALFFLISLALVVFLLRRLDLAETIETLRRADPVFITLACLVYFAANYFKTIRYHFLLRDLGVGIGPMYAISAYQNFFNQIMPARTGELTFVYYLKKIGRGDLSRGLHSLLVTRIFDLIVVAAFFVFSAVVYFGKKPSFILIAAGAAFFAVSVALLFNMKWLVMFSSRVFFGAMRLLRMERRPLVEKIKSKIDPVVEEFAGFETRRHVPMLALTSILVWAALYLYSYLCILAFRVDVSFLQSVAGSTGAVLTNVLPINSFGSFGTLEAGWTGGFVMVGMSEQDAIITGFGTHIINFIASAILAGACMVLLRAASRKKKAREVGR
jgi:glycosyltransferase 2 family protein